MAGLTVSQLRAEAREKYKRGSGQENLKGYARMSRAELMARLGKSTEEKRDNRAVASSKTADAIASRLASGADDKAVARVQAKARLLRAVKRDIDAARKANPNVSQEELRKVAGKAFLNEAKAIKEGKAEVKAKRGGGQKQGALDPKKAQEREKIADTERQRFLHPSKDPYGRRKELLDEVAKTGDIQKLSAAAGNHFLNMGIDKTQVFGSGRKSFDEFARQMVDSHKRASAKTAETPAPAAAKSADSEVSKHKAEVAKLAAQVVRHKDDPATVGPLKAELKAAQKRHQEAIAKSEQKIKPEEVKSAADKAKFAKQEADHQRSLGNEKGAKAWEQEAKLARMLAVKRDLDKGKQEQTSLFGVTEHSSDMPLFAQEDGKPKAKKSSLPEVAKGLHEVDPKELDFDPKRFQYKMVHGATGASGSLEGVGKWDENLGGVLQVWRDPKDGKDYVVNGHNRLNLAKKLGAESVAVRYLSVKTPEEARAIGALANIAEGRGNAMDAAKFFRDSGMTREAVEKAGIPLKEKIASDGLSLSRLAPHLFDKVVHGDLTQEQGAIIGKHLDDHESQSKLHDLITKETKKGRKITNDTIRELAQTVQSAPTHSETQFSLFGAEETSRNLALEKAELQAAVRQRLSREKKLFGIVAKSKAAEELAKAGNVIDQGKSKDVSQQAGQVLSIFDELKNKTGPVSSAINKATERIANGENKAKVIDELHKQLVQEIPQQLGIKRKSA